VVVVISATDARVIEVRPFRVQDELARGRIVVVAGYQGVSYKREVPRWDAAPREDSSPHALVATPQMRYLVGEDSLAVSV